MKIVLKNTKLVFQKVFQSFTGKIIAITDPSIVRLISPTSAPFNVVSNNLFDASSVVTGKIKNDSGSEISDGASSYCAYFIPVEPGMKLKSNFLMQRIYKFDINKDWIGREASASTRTIYTVPNGVYFLQIQIAVKTGFDNFQLNYGTEADAFVAHQINTIGNTYPPKCYAYADDLSEITLLGVN